MIIKYFLNKNFSEELKKELVKQTMKKYVLHNKDGSAEELLKYKLDYIFENINKLTDYKVTMNYLENIICMLLKIYYLRKNAQEYNLM